MQLGKFSDYGLRVLIYLATAHPSRASAAEMARCFGLSDHHLAKVCSRLVHGGFLTSERGRMGGLRLARDAADIHLGAALRCLSQHSALVECFGAGPCSCRILPLCGVRAPLAEALEAFYTTLDSYTLADITKDRAPLRALLLSD